MTTPREHGGSPCVVDVINLASSANTLLRERVLAMRRRGVDNRIVCMDGPEVPMLRAAGIPVHTVPLLRGGHPFRLALSLVDMARYLRRHRVDLVHTHCSVPGAVGRVAAWLAGVPVIVHTVHGFHFHARMHPARRWPCIAVEWLCGRVTDMLLTQNRTDLDEAERLGIGPRVRRVCIGNGIALGPFADVRRRPRADGPPTLVCVARLEPVKHHAMLLDALGALKGRGVAFRARLAGEGPLRPSLQATCRRLGLERDVEFLGYRTDIPALLAEGDVAVLTSIKEGVPRAVLEGMAAGLPVVATRVPGTREVVGDGETGVLVELDDRDALARALERLIADPALRTEMGARGRALAFERYDERSVIDRLHAIYRARLLARAQPVPAGTEPRVRHEHVPAGRHVHR